METESWSVDDHLSNLEIDHPPSTFGLCEHLLRLARFRLTFPVDLPLIPRHTLVT
jgi:hypothetical protein